MALRARKVSGAFEKRAPVLEPRPLDPEASALTMRPLRFPDLSLSHPLLPLLSHPQPLLALHPSSLTTLFNTLVGKSLTFCGNKTPRFRTGQLSCVYTRHSGHYNHKYHDNCRRWFHLSS